MSHLRGLLRRLCNRRVGVTFALYAGVAVVLAVLGLVVPVSAPGAVATVLEALFVLFVYLPLAVVGALLYEPLGVDALLTAPRTGDLLIVATLVGFYYLVAVVQVSASDLAHSAIAWHRPRS